MRKIMYNKLWVLLLLSYSLMGSTCAGLWIDTESDFSDLQRQLNRAEDRPRTPNQFYYPPVIIVNEDDIRADNSVQPVSGVKGRRHSGKIYEDDLYFQSVDFPSEATTERARSSTTTSKFEEQPRVKFDDKSDNDVNSASDKSAIEDDSIDYTVDFDPPVPAFSAKSRKTVREIDGSQFESPKAKEGQRRGLRRTPISNFVDTTSNRNPLKYVPSSSIKSSGEYFSDLRLINKFFELNRVSIFDPRQQPNNRPRATTNRPVVRPRPPVFERRPQSNQPAPPRRIKPVNPATAFRPGNTNDNNNVLRQQGDGRFNSRVGVVSDAAKNRACPGGSLVTCQDVCLHFSRALFQNCRAGCVQRCRGNGL